MATTRIVSVSIGKPFETGEECPACHFDSMVAALVTVGSSPGFKMLCGRRVCRDGEDA